MAEERKLTGGCLCAAIRYEAKGPRVFNIVCHCRMCQRALGAPLTALFYVPTKNIVLTKGTPAFHSSSETVDRYFCRECGSPLFFQRTNFPERRAIFVGSLDDPNDFTPEMHVCLSSSVSWMTVQDDVARYEEKPEGMSPTLDYDPVTGVVR